MTEPRKKRDANDVVPHRVELAGQTVAGGVGSAFGAAKLRDEYKREHPAKFDRKVLRVTNRAIRHGAKPETVTRAVHAVQAGKPNFRALIVATGAGGTAAAAHHYQQINDWSKKRKAQVSGLVKTAAFDVPARPGNRTVGPKVRVRATPPARHAARPHVGAHRKMSPLDNVKATAVLHSKHLAGAMEGLTDLFKAGCPKCAALVAGEARYGHVEGLGKVQILGHHAGQIAHVLDRSDTARLVPTAKLRPHRPRRGPVTKSVLQKAEAEHLAKADPRRSMRAWETRTAADRRAGIVPPSGAPAKAAPRVEDVRAARRNRLVRATKVFKKSAFGTEVEIEKAHVLRDVAALGGATAAGALLAKPGLAASASKVAKTRVTRPFMRSFRNPGGGGRPMPGPIGKSAESVELLKASAFGTKGDKRNTKYYGAAYGGAAAGGFAGRQVATRTAGTRPMDVNRLVLAHTRHRTEQTLEGHSTPAMLAATRHLDVDHPIRSGFKGGRAAVKASMGDVTHSVPGAARMVRGGKVGAASGAVAGTAAYAAHRHRKGMAKSAFGVELAKAEKKKPSVGRVAAGTAFSGLHGAVAGKKGKKLKATGSEIGHSIGGSVLGAVPGAILKKPALSAAGGYGGSYGGAATAVYSNQRKGRYKRES